jgi:uncharacterized lipoprotein YajG
LYNKYITKKTKKKTSMKKTIIAIMASVFLMAACTTGETKNEVPATDSTAVKTDSTAVKADTSAVDTTQCCAD